NSSSGGRAGRTTFPPGLVVFGARKCKGRNSVPKNGRPRPEGAPPRSGGGAPGGTPGKGSRPPPGFGRARFPGGAPKNPVPSPLLATPRVGDPFFRPVWEDFQIGPDGLKKLADPKQDAAGDNRLGPMEALAANLKKPADALFDRLEAINFGIVGLPAGK